MHTATLTPVLAVPELDSTSEQAAASEAEDSCDSSIRSYKSTDGSQRSSKKVRFEEHVHWTYIEEEMEELSPEMKRRSSLWQRFKQLNFSSESDLGLGAAAQEDRPAFRRSTSASDLTARHRNSSSDLLGTVLTKSLNVANYPRQTSSYSVKQPLRETAGLRFTRADHRATTKSAASPLWTASATTLQKGDWGDLLGRA